MLTTDSNNNKPSILKNTRETKGLTLEIVHEATKIPMDALRAIEEGYSVRILSPFYYRGFIKIYAEFLGLNVQEMYKEYGLDQPSKVATAVSASTKSSRKTPVGPNPFIEQAQEWSTAILNPKIFKLILRILVFIILIFLLFKTAGCVASHWGKNSNQAQKHSLFFWQDKKTESTKAFEEEKSVPATPVVKHEVLQAQSENNQVEVAVRATRNTWIQVKADGKVVFQMTLAKGSMESWSADNRIELSGRNIEQLDMEVNGKHIGSLGGGERRIRKVVITQEGLTVKK